MPPIDGLLFLQHRAGDRRLRNGGVLVSSQAGCLCFWSVTGQTHSYGEQEGREGMFKESSWREDKIDRHEFSSSVVMVSSAPLQIPFLAVRSCTFFQIQSLLTGVGFKHCDHCALVSRGVAV